LSGRPLTPPCVPFGTRRFNGYVRFRIACSMAPVIDFDAFEVSLSSTLLSSFSCFRITAITHQCTFHSLLRHPLFSPSRSVRVPSIRVIIPFTVLWPLLTSGRSAIHHCMGCFRITIQTSPGKSR
jgi:hypothetical protein